MYHYAAYGLSLQSEFELPELLETPAPSPASQADSPSVGPDVRIVPQAIDRRTPVGVSGDSSVWATSDAAFIDYPGAVAFLIREGREIIVDAIEGCEPRLVRLFLLGPALALLLHQRKFLVLHASAVKIDGQAIAFVGEKGMGKSTMAAAFHGAATRWWPMIWLPLTWPDQCQSLIRDFHS